MFFPSRRIARCHTWQIPPLQPRSTPLPRALRTRARYCESAGTQRQGGPAANAWDLKLKNVANTAAVLFGGRLLVSASPSPLSLPTLPHMLQPSTHLAGVTSALLHRGKSSLSGDSFFPSESLFVTRRFGRPRSRTCSTRARSARSGWTPSAVRTHLRNGHLKRWGTLLTWPP